jgi:hypothetical protein
VPSKSSCVSLVLDDEIPESSGQLGPVSHADLPERVRDVALYRLRRQEQHPCDLAVGRTLGDEAGDLLLSLGQRLACGGASPGAHAERAKSTLGELSHRAGAEHVGVGDRVLELGRRPLVAGIGECACEVEPGLERLQPKRRFLGSRQHCAQACGS